MNEEIEPFEQRLKRLPIRQVPTGWRDGILSATAEAQPRPRPAAISGGSFLSTLSRRLASIFWPHPVAWGALAAIWILILAVNFSIRDSQLVTAEKIAAPSPEVVAELRAQHRLFSGLIGADPSDLSDADPQKRFVPRPRSERIGFLTA